MPIEDPIAYVVDDDPSVRTATLLLLASMQIRAEAFASAQEFLNYERPNLPCCLILDVRMPTMSGLELQRTLTEAGDNVPIVFLTGHGDIPMAVEAVRKGAVDFLTKPFDDHKLLNAVQRALQSHQLALHDAASRDILRMRFESLTKRQRQVLELVVQGRLNKQIAKELGISESTVKAHRAQIKDKMRLKSVAELATALADMRT